MTRLEQVRKEMTAARSANLDRVSAMLAGSGLSEGAQAAVRVVLDETNTTFAVGVITIMTGVDKEERRATLALAAGRRGEHVRRLLCRWLDAWGWRCLSWSMRLRRTP